MAKLDLSSMGKIDLSSILPDKLNLKGNKSEFSTVISVDPRASAVHFYSMTAGDKDSLTHDVKNYRARPFDKEFFQIFTKYLEEYSQQYPSVQTAATTLIMPDNIVATDLVSVPTMSHRRTEDSVNVAIDTLYKNRHELRINHCMTAQNKQYTTFALTAIRQEILSAFYTACATNKMTPQCVTFASNSAANAVQIINPKLKSTSFLLLDIKPEFTRVSIVVKGRAAGCYFLPFGFSILQKVRLAAEDMLFDHSVGELVVLNAKEKARAKQLTMMGEDAAAQLGSSMAEDAAENGENGEAGKPAEEDDWSEEAEARAEAEKLTAQPIGAPIKSLPKKQPRKLPKFMLRPQPSGEREYAYENFRIFVKWALNILQANEKLTMQGAPEAVYVNMPEEFDYLFDMVNEEQEENGILFASAGCNGEKELINRNLELYGGFFAPQLNKSNNF